ncbi:alpha-galactosidase [Kitasatospora sp. GAS204A]|uniref:alpha-galactosidase n=1 Tax=unclassified Kitasatospora TaxID=2633591 RepID=UPI00247485D4|nr:alpha-galactosidase [Kitasatospora sp. GAS204B]MDH6121776.1 alpha-galactosidase [Kitasatospora sp. GAS204B]
MRATRSRSTRLPSLLLTLTLATPGLGALAVTTAPPAAALGNGNALTPPMGWNSWNSLGPSVNEQQVKQTIDFMSSNGLVPAGYNTVTIDDGWSLRHRDGQSTDFVKNADNGMQLYDNNGNPVSGTDGTGNDPTSGHLVPDPSSFPSQTVNGQTMNGIQYLAWYAHSKGMKFGLYGTDTYTTCQGHPGSLGHESTDAGDFVSWGVDFVKYDDCPYGPTIVGPDGYSYYPQGEGKELTESIYARTQTFQRALDAATAAAGRPKVTLSLSAQPAHTGIPYLLNANDPARTDPLIVAAGVQPHQAAGYYPTGVWCGQVANMCRIGGDRDSELDGVLYNGQLQTALKYPGNVHPGSWNDMDMMFAGWQDPYGVWGVTDTYKGNKPFTDDESRTELSVLSMMAAPLISGADLRTAADSQHTASGYTWSTGINSSALGLLKNPDMIAIDQDSLAKPATLVGNPPASSTAPVILERRLANGDLAVALINQDPNNWAMPSASFAALGLTGASYSYRDLWTGATGTLTGTVGGSWIPAHGVTLLRIAGGAVGMSGGGTGTGGGQTGIVGDGKYHAISAGGTAGQALEVQGGCNANVGGNSDINAYQSGNAAQQWLFTPNADGTVTITDNCYTSAQNHTVLAAGGGVGTAYLLNPSANNPWQKWKVTQNSAGALTITNVGNGLTLDVAGSTAGSTGMTNPANTGAAGQSWTVLS